MIASQEQADNATDKGGQLCCDEMSEAEAVQAGHLSTSELVFHYQQLPQQLN